MVSCTWDTGLLLCYCLVQVYSRPSLHNAVMSYRTLANIKKFQKYVLQSIETQHLQTLDLCLFFLFFILFLFYFFFCFQERKLRKNEANA